MARENLIHREGTSDEAWPIRDLTLDKKVLWVIRDRGDSTSGEIKQALSDMGFMHHHGSVSSAIHNLEASGLIERRGDTRVWGRTNRKQNVMVVRLAVGPVNIGRHPLPSKEDLDIFLASMRRIWPKVVHDLGDREKEAVIAATLYLKDMNEWRPRLGKRRQR